MLWLSLLLAAAPCTTRSECALDPTTSTCHAAQKGTGEGGPVNGSGPTCVCESGECQAITVEPVACQSYRDCSYTREPFLHPVSAKKVPREFKKPVRPCKDSERDAVCDPKSKTCRVVSWSC